MGSWKEYPGVEINGKKIRIYFRLDGKLHRKALNKEPTKTNLINAANLVENIKTKIRAGNFNWYEFFPEDAPKELETKTFLKVSRQYLASVSHLAKSTSEGYRKILNTHFIPWLGNLPIDQITYGMLAELMNDKEWPSNKTRNNALTPLRGVFELALLDGLIETNPTVRLKARKHQKPTPDPLSLQEIDVVLDNLTDKQWKNYFEFAFFSGLRTSEIISLQWGDVDWNNETVRVQRAKVRGELKETKTGEIRDVELNSRALSALTKQKEHTFLADNEIFQHPNIGGELNNDKPPRLAWTAALKKAGIRHRAAYQTRHTFATMNLMAHANPMWVAQQMGHTNMRMTLERYAKWIPQDNTEKDKLESLLQAKV